MITTLIIIAAVIFLIWFLFAVVTPWLAQRWMKNKAKNFVNSDVVKSFLSKSDDD